MGDIVAPAPMRSTCSVQILWNLADGKSGEIVRYLPDKKLKFRLALQLSQLRESRPKISQGQLTTMYILQKRRYFDHEQEYAMKLFVLLYC